MKISKVPPLFAVGAVLLAVPSARAQRLLTQQYDHPATTPAYVTGDAKAVALGQFTDDAIPDACVLHGTEAHLIRSVDRRSAWRKLSGNYTAIARLPLGQWNGRDDVIAIGASGLVVLEWNGTPGVETLLPRVLSGTAGWANATHLQVESTPEGAIEVVALAANTRTILRAIHTGAGGGLNQLDAIDLPSSATDMTPIEFVEGGEFEYAYAGTWGVAICDAWGADLFNVDASSSRSLLERVPIDGELDRLAWVRGPSGMTDFLSVIRPSGAQDPAIWLSGANLAGFHLVDLCEDSLPELLLLADGLGFAIGLKRGTSTTFQDVSATQFILDLERGNSLVGSLSEYPFDPGTGVVAGAYKAPVPDSMDLDGDGDEDLFLAGHPSGAGRAMLYLGARVEEEAWQNPSSNSRAWIPGYTASLSHANDQFQVIPALAAQPTSGPSKDATHLRYTLWTQAQTASAIDWDSEQVFELDLTAGGNPSPPVFDFTNISGLGDGWVHIESSFLQRDATGAMVAAFPAYHEKIALSWYDRVFSYDFEDNTAGIWGPPQYQDSEVGGVGGTSGRPPITPPSGGGG